MTDDISKVVEARQIIDEFIQCSNVGRSDGKLVSAAKDWLAATDRIESAAAPVGVVDEAMVERAAIAIHNCGRNRTFRGPWDGYFPDYQDKIREQARAALQAAQPAVPSVPEGFDIGRANTLIQYVMGYCRSAEMRTLSSDAIQALKQLESMLAAIPKDQPAQGVDGE